MHSQACKIALPALTHCSTTKGTHVAPQYPFHTCREKKRSRSVLKSQGSHSIPYTSFITPPAIALGETISSAVAAPPPLQAPFSDTALQKHCLCWSKQQILVDIQIREQQQNKKTNTNIGKEEMQLISIL